MPGVFNFRIVQAGNTSIYGVDAGCLARVNGQFVDYRDLSVRYLGTI